MWSLSNATTSEDPATGARGARMQQLHVWDPLTWDTLAVREEAATGTYSPMSTVAFSPTESLVAILGENDSAILIWELDIMALLQQATRTSRFPH